MQTTGERIRQLRDSKGLTQAQMATLLGVSKSLISLWESNQKNPSVKASLRITNNFSVTLDYLWGTRCEN